VLDLSVLDAWKAELNRHHFHSDGSAFIKKQKKRFAKIKEIG